MTSLEGINGRSIQTLLRGENDSKQSDEFQANEHALNRESVPLMIAYDPIAESPFQAYKSYPAIDLIPSPLIRGSRVENLLAFTAIIT